jgi:predicted DNA-binding transcriptional regulator AlpA
VDLLTLNAVLELTGLSRSTLHRYRTAGTFPSAVSLGHQRAVLFRSDQVDEWLKANPVRSPRFHHD